MKLQLADRLAYLSTKGETASLALLFCGREVAMQPAEIQEVTCRFLYAC